MKTIFVIYPHCLLRTNGNEILIVDSTNDVFHYTNEHEVAALFTDNVNMADVSSSKSAIEFANECFKKRLGFVLETMTEFPFISDSRIKFITSLEKEKRAMGNNLGKSTEGLLKIANVFFKNSIVTKRPKGYYQQLDFPCEGASNNDILSIVNMLIEFPNLTKIIISGDFDNRLANEVSHMAAKEDVSVLLRCFYTPQIINSIYSVLTNCKNCSAELILRTDNITEFCENREYIIPCDRIRFSAAVSSQSDISRILQNNIPIDKYWPILGDDDELKQEMLLSKGEILSSDRKIIREKMVINPNFFGYITIENDGVVSCAGAKIGKLLQNNTQKNSLSQLLNKWASERNCLWFLTRSKKTECQSCVFNILCPAITRFEVAGLLNKACY